MRPQWRLGAGMAGVPPEEGGLTSFDRFIRIADRLEEVAAGSIEADRTIHAALGQAAADAALLARRAGGRSGGGGWADDEAGEGR